MKKHQIAEIVAKGDYSIFNEELVGAIREALATGKVSLIIDLLAVAHAVGQSDVVKQMSLRLAQQAEDAERNIKYHTSIGE